MSIEISKINSILYVEDEVEMQKELSRTLHYFCEKLYIANDGVEGLEKFKEYQPTLVISDIQMPNKNGIDMCKEIRKINEKTPLIFTTAFSDAQYFQEAIELQVEGYLLKPLDLDLVEKKVNSVIRQIKIREELVKKDKLLIHQSKMASMGEMISNISHQWRQPLSAISMLVSNVQVQLDMQEKIDKELIESCSKEVMSQIEYLSHTIDDFRTFLKPTTNVTTGEFIFDLKEFIEKCITLIESSFKDNMISIIKDIDSKINSTGSHNYLLQALINILNNAKDALDSVSDSQKRLVFIMTAKEDKENNIIITIKDNAGGISEDIIDRVFEPYFTTKSSVVGTGLGLYITHEIIVKEFHGSILVENDEYEYEGNSYKGAKFTIKIPIKEKYGIENFTQNG